MNQTALLALALTACTQAPTTEPRPYYALDGDTIATASGPHIRLARIDAPEMPDHCRPGRRCVQGDPWLAQQMLQTLLDDAGDTPLICNTIQIDIYHRRIADCTLAGQNLSDLMFASGTVGVYQR